MKITQKRFDQMYDHAISIAKEARKFAEQCEDENIRSSSLVAKHWDNVADIAFELAELLVLTASR